MRSQATPANSTRKAVSILVVVALGGAIVLPALLFTVSLFGASIFRAAAVLERVPTDQWPAAVVAFVILVGAGALVHMTLSRIARATWRAVVAGVPAWLCMSPRSKQRMWALVALVILMVLAGRVHADPGAPTTPSQLMNAAANGGRDQSIQILTGALGDFFAHPLSQVGGPSTILGTMFVIFNGSIFAVAGIWGTWNIARGVISTAHEGQVLGQKLSAVWLPIRMVTGIVGVAPVFGGFSLFQVVVVLCATLGIGMANLIWSGAVSSLDQFQSLVSPPVGKVIISNTLHESAIALFRIHLCEVANRADQQAREQQGILTSPNEVIESHEGPWNLPGGDPSLLASVQVGSNLNPTSCGRVNLYRTDGAARSADSVWFRNQAVDYTQIASAVQQASASAFHAVDGMAAQLSADWFQALQAWRNQGSGPMPLPPLTQLHASAESANGTINQAVQDANNLGSGAISEQAKGAMLNAGWIGAGAWYSTFAEASAAMREAAQSTHVTTSPPEPQPADTIAERTMLSFDQATALLEKESAAASGSPSTAPNGKAVGEGDSAWDKVKSLICGRFVGYTPTGNCSIGQALVAKALPAGDAGLIDPITTIKNMGDAALGLSESLMVGAAWLTGADESLIGSMAERTVSSVGLFTPGGAAATVAVGFVKVAIGVLPTAAMGLMALAVAMSVWVPLIPWLTWTGALTQYFVVLIEGLIAAPLGALAHMEAEGEGMGQRTERLYLFFLNALARPACMLFGFMMAATLLTLLGTLVAHQFLPAMANAQGNSLTGLASVIGYLVVFWLVVWSMTQSLFNMTMLLPDQVLGYLGTSHTSDLGRGNEEHGRTVFMGSLKSSSHPVAAAARPALSNRDSRPQSPASPQQGESSGRSRT